MGILTRPKQKSQELPPKRPAGGLAEVASHTRTCLALIRDELRCFSPILPRRWVRPLNPSSTPPQPSRTPNSILTPPWRSREGYLAELAELLLLCDEVDALIGYGRNDASHSEDATDDGAQLFTVYGLRFRV